MLRHYAFGCADCSEGIQNPVIRLIIEQANVPVLVDAGVGTASMRHRYGIGLRWRADEYGIAEAKISADGRGDAPCGIAGRQAYWPTDVKAALCRSCSPLAGLI